MKTKQIAIVLCIGRYGNVSGYSDLASKLNDGWIVNRVDYVYNDAGQSTRTIYILEKEIEEHD